jgi:hypothetical protein
MCKSLLFMAGVCLWLWPGSLAAAADDSLGGSEPTMVGSDSTGQPRRLTAAADSLAQPGVATHSALQTTRLQTLNARLDSLRTVLEQARIRREEGAFVSNVNTSDWGTGWYAGVNIIKRYMTIGRLHRLDNNWRCGLAFDWAPLLEDFMGEKFESRAGIVVATPVMFTQISMSGFLKAQARWQSPTTEISKWPRELAQSVPLVGAACGLNVEFWLDPRCLMYLGTEVSYYYDSEKTGQYWRVRADRVYDNRHYLTMNGVQIGLTTFLPQKGTGPKRSGK